jgi:GDPmannose 4,6-dehydratase
MKKRKALISGINGMDGSHLAELLLEKDYEVFGIERRKANEDRRNTIHLINHINFLKGDLSDQNSLVRCLKESNPDEVYNLASQSFVEDSWDTPEVIANTTGVGVLRMLEAIREYGNKNIRFYQASSSEMFGKMVENPAKETTPFYPRSPYGVAKLYGHLICKNYRESYNMFICNGILFNHEGERRGETFVTRKITMALAHIKNYLDCERLDFPKLKLGNLYSKRDWGYAKDYVEGMWRMLQQDNPDDYVLATGETHTIKEFVELACRECGWNINWVGEGVDEKGILDNGVTIIEIDEKYYRPAEVDVLLGDYTKAKNILGWTPEVKFNELVKIMMRSDLKKINTV